MGKILAGRVESPREMTLRIYLDTNVFIEAIEQQNGLASMVARTVLSMVDAGIIEAVISELVVAELLVKPLQNNDQRLIDTYSALLQPQIGYVTRPVDRESLIEAARQRAINPGTKLPDAIHIATARLHECKVFLTTETRLCMPRDLIRLNLDNSAITDLQALA